jgi:hypothetical protein
MSLRFVMLSCAAAMIVAAVASAEAREGAARCEQTSFRIYFQHDSAALDDAAWQVLSVAERDVGGCGYAELHVMVDPASARAAERGQAIRAAANGRAWNVVRLERLPALRRAVFGAGPDYAEVTMTPNVLPVTNELIGPDVGV